MAGVVTDATGYTGAIGLCVQLHWTIELEGPDNYTVTPSTLVIHPDAGWTNIFTTSDGSFDSKVLTFKMHNGGDMVPFSAAAPHLVYTNVSGTHVYYNDSAGKEHECRYFARVQGYTTPGFLLFNTKQDALDYIRTGDVKTALQYTSASRLATPAVPSFVSLATTEEQVGNFSALTTSPDALLRLESLVNTLLAIQARVAEAPTGALGSPVHTFVDNPVPLARSLESLDLSE